MKSMKLLMPNGALVAALCTVTACAHHPQYPVTEQGRAFTALDAAETHAAPDVASGVTADRIARARG